MVQLLLPASVLIIIVGDRFGQFGFGTLHMQLWFGCSTFLALCAHDHTQKILTYHTFHAPPPPTPFTLFLHF